MDRIPMIRSRPTLYRFPDPNCYQIDPERVPG